MSVLVCSACTARYAVGALSCPQCGANDPREENDAPGVLPSLTVACLPGNGCRYTGVRRRVPLTQIVPGVIPMPRLTCAGCGAELATVTDEPEQEDSMPKVTVHTGPSHEAAELADGDTSSAEGGEQSSPGPNSETSSEKPQTSPETSESEDQSPARKTGSRSAKGRTGSSSARGTDGGQTAPTSDTDKD